MPLPAAAAATHSRSLSSFCIFLVIVLAAYLVGRMTPPWEWLTAHMMPVTNQGDRYPYLLELFANAVASGAWYPRWLPELSGGYGYPTFVFYGPGFWFIALPFYWLTDNAMAATYFTLFTLLSLGGIGVYKMARLYAPMFLALALAAGFLLTPYLLDHLYTRGRFGEITAMAFLPWALYFNIRTHRAVLTAQSSILLIMGWLAALMGVVYGHPFAAYWFATITLLLNIGLLLTHPKRLLWFGYLVVVLIAALALSLAYWLPIWQLASHVTEGSARMARFLPDRWSEWKNNPLGQSNLALLVVTGAASLLVIRRAPLALLCAAMGLAMVWFQHFGKPWWHSLPGLSYTQMATRNMPVVMVLLGLSVSMIAAAARPWLAWALTGAVIGAMVVNLPMLQGQVKLTAYQHSADQARNSWTNMTHTGEFAPRKADIRGLPNRNRNTTPPIAKGCDGIRTRGRSRIVSYEASSHHIEAKVDLRGRQRSVACFTLQQFYLPGWKILINGKRQPPLIDKHGRMILGITQPGTYKIDAYYAGPPHYHLRNGGMVLALLIAGYGLFRLERKRVTA